MTIEAIVLEKTEDTPIKPEKVMQVSVNTKVHKKHDGQTKLLEYRIWLNMIQRCHNPNTSNYANYGGRGIKVCERWRQDFRNFYADMGKRPISEHTKYSIERINNDGDYEPANCKWIPIEEQWLNRRIPTKKTNYPPIRCMECKIEFKPRVREQRFCSKTCRQKYHNDTYYAGKAARMVLKKHE